MITSLLATLTLAQAAVPQAAAPQAAVAPVTYVQSSTLPDGKFEIRTAAQQLVQPGKPDIWLVGAIHIGAKQYYTSIQTLLDSQESVFFERVKASPAPPAAAKPAPKPAAKTDDQTPAKPIYQVLSDAIGLDFQLNDIQYDRPNWKNVDLSWAELQKMNKDSSGGKPTQFDTIANMLDPNSPTAKMFANFIGNAPAGTKEAFKMFLVKNVATAGAGMMAPETEKIILKARNKAVMDEFASTFAAPTQPKSIGVFYGAMHLPDLQNSLVSQYGYRLGEKRWFLAADADPKKMDDQGRMMLDMMEKQIAAMKAKPAPKG